MSKITQQKKEAKKINQILPKTTFISVVDDSYTHEADPEDSWRANSTSTSHDIRGIKIHPSYGDIECMFDVLPDTTYYLLYYLYGTGDSFSSHTGHIEFVELYRDEKLAEKSRAAMNKFNSYVGTKKNKQNPVTIWNDSGQTYEEYLNDDYFGGFEGANVVAVQLI